LGQSTPDFPEDTIPVHASRPLRERARAPSEAELAGIPWLAVLEPEDRQRARASIMLASAAPGEQICRVGRPATYWFGEGTLLKREPYRYNIEALRKTTVAGLPVDSFHDLLARSLPFNRFVLNQLNERLGQFIAARETDRLSDPDARVARNLAALFHPVLYPGVGQLLRITQQELGYLVGLSRQRVNEALRALQAAQLIEVEYGGLRVLNLQGLRNYAPPG
jgi:hypothetical protein